MDTSIAVQLGLATAMAAFSNDSDNYEAVKQKIESQRGVIRGVVEKQVYDSYLHTYEKMSTQEMGLYIDFLESGPRYGVLKRLLRVFSRPLLTRLNLSAIRWRVFSPLKNRVNTVNVLDTDELAPETIRSRSTNRAGKRLSCDQLLPAGDSQTEF